MRISDWSSDVCSSDLSHCDGGREFPRAHRSAGARSAVPGRILGDRAGLRRGRGMNIVIPGPYIELRGTRPRDELTPFADVLTSPFAGSDQSETPAASGFGTLAKIRSEEHTSELQSLMRISYAVFCLKKKKKQQQQANNGNRITNK